MFRGLLFIFLKDYFRGYFVVKIKFGPGLSSLTRDTSKIYYFSIKFLVSAAQDTQIFGVIPGARAIGQTCPHTRR